MRQKLIIANWKMNGSTVLLERLLPPLVRTSVKPVQVVVCPPMAYLAQAGALLAGSRIMLGAQNASEHNSGAYTGETSVTMVKELGCKYVLVGHSERRHHYGETDDLVADKFASIYKAGLVPVLCIGETEAERDANKTREVVLRQVDAILEKLGPCALFNAVVAYDPRWAIGTGNTATPEQAQSVHQMVREHISEADPIVARHMPILYGGSVNADNIADLLAMPDIDGGLVGGASLESEEFIDTCRAARLLRNSMEESLP